jgi:hypothetical protein
VRHDESEVRIIPITIAIVALLVGCGPSDTPAKAESASVDAEAPLASLARRFSGAELRLLESDGVEKRPFATAPRGALAVLVFLYPDCPIANAYAPELLRLRRSFAGESLTWHFVHADPKVEAAAASKHAEEFQLSARAEDLGPARVWIDRHHDAVRTTGASVTPEAVVLVREEDVWRMDYRGRIDDLFVDFGQRRSRASTRDLHDAIQRSLGEAPSELQTKRAIGCYIEVEAR